MKRSTAGWQGSIVASLMLWGCGEPDADVVQLSNLSAGDSADIWAAVIEASLMEAEMPLESDRIWVPGALVEDRSGPYREGAPALSAPVQERIQRAIPGVRFVEDWPNLFQSVFECPPGVKVAMPGSGCPIEDDGVVVILGPLWIDEGGALRSESSVVQSHRPPDREKVYTWMRGFRIRVEQTESGEWVIDEIGLSWVT